MYDHAIIACARWEEAYIAEWLAFYKKIGFDHVFLYCNDDDPTVLRQAVEAAPLDVATFVTFAHFAGQGRQSQMYRDGLRVARSRSRWITFLDIDEFLILKGAPTIADFLKPFDERGVGSVHFNWVMFGNSGHKERPPGKVTENYRWRAVGVDPNTKHISRSDLLTEARVGSSNFPFWHGLSDHRWSGVPRENVLRDPMGPLLSDFPDNMRTYLQNPDRNAAIVDTAFLAHVAFKAESDFLRRALRGTAGEFSGQAGWKNVHDNGQVAEVLKGLNAVEDDCLRKRTV